MANDKSKDKDKDEDGAEDGAAAAGGKSGGSKKLILIIAGALALVIASVGGTMLVTGLFSKSEPVKKVVKKTADETEGEEKDAETKDGEKDNGKDKAEGEGEEETNPDGTPRVAVYMDFEQPFVVNFQDEGQLRYLQITVSAMTKNPKVAEEMKRHMPLIRNNLVMLFSGQTREGIISREGKEKIRKDAEAEVQKILKEQTGNPGVKALYFTSFVMQ
ncbi:MAG TPA: flagellar basal body-associated FliL family protein [Acidiferrobacterales bacterium]|nr:flagellar basal body-associated FliL family protein [Acidiferrobacterales bacterium]